MNPAQYIDLPRNLTGYKRVIIEGQSADLPIPFNCFKCGVEPSRYWSQKTSFYCAECWIDLHTKV